MSLELPLLSKQPYESRFPAPRSADMGVLSSTQVPCVEQTNGLKVYFNYRQTLESEFRAVVGCDALISIYAMCQAL